jgi:hypothetical protein
MDRKYKGLRENGQWEEFYSDSVEDARPENSGYEKVIDVETGEELK